MGRLWIKTEGIIVSRHHGKKQKNRSLCQFQDQDGKIWHGDVYGRKVKVGDKCQVSYLASNPSENDCEMPGETRRQIRIFLTFFLVIIAFLVFAWLGGFPKNSNGEIPINVEK